MFIFIGGVLYSLDPPNAYFWGVRTPPTPPRESTRLLPVISVILSYLKVAYFQNKLAFSTRYINKITVIYQCVFPGNTVLHFVITHMLSSKFIRRIGSVMFQHQQLKMV